MLSQTLSTLDPSLTLPGSVFAGQLFLTPNTPSYRIPPPLSPPRIPPHRDTNGSSGSQSDSDTDAIAPSLSSASDDLDDVSEADTETSEDAPYSSGSDFEAAEDLPVLTHPPYRTALGVRFLSRSSLLADIQSFAKANGFGVTITRSSNKRVGYQYMQLKCVHGGRPGTHRKDYEKQRRRTIWARQRDCLFFIYARNHGGTDVFGTPHEEDWRIDIETQCDDHNHPPSRPIDMSIHRKASMTTMARSFLAGQIELRNKPRRIHAVLTREFPSLLITRHDIYNAGFRHRWAERNGHTSSEAIVRKLQDDGELSRAFVDDQRRCVGLLYTTREARALTHRFPTVLFVDTTFQTNRYGLSMLHIAGFTATGHTYTSAVVFMLMQTTEWYELAIKTYLDFVQVPKPLVEVVITDREPAVRNALHSLLPDTYQLLCYWHLSENVKGNTAKYFKRLARRKPDYDPEAGSKAFRKCWKANIVEATTKAAISAGFDTIRAAFPEPELEKAHKYLKGLQGHRKRFISAYIDRYRHLGQRTTSRLEGTHKALKDHLDSHHDDLYEVIRGLKLYFKDQWDARLIEFGKHREISDIGVSKVFARVKGRVSRQAIDLVKAQLAIAAKLIAAESRGDRTTPCTNHFHSSYGLPCSHRLKDLVIRRGYLEMEAFHNHWRLPTERELRDWMEDAENSLPGTLQPPDTTETILPPSFTFPNDNDDQDIILDPPHRPRKRGRRRRANKTRSRRTETQTGEEAGGEQAGGGSEQEDHEPEQHPSGRWVGRHERQARPLQQRRFKCSACGEQGHNMRSKDCPVRRQNRRQEVEDARNDIARNRRPLQESQAANRSSLPGTVDQSSSNVDIGSILGGSGHGLFDGLDQGTAGQEGNLLSEPALTEDLIQLWQDIDRVGNDLL